MIPSFDKHEVFIVLGGLGIAVFLLGCAVGALITALNMV